MTTDLRDTDILLHSCCGPCACGCVPVLRERGARPSMLFANSNIDTETEFARRLDSARRVASAENIEIFVIPYNHADWLEKVARGYENAPEKGARCERCFLYNLTLTARFAQQHNFTAFTTSLTVSPHKISAKVFAAGREAETLCKQTVCNDNPPPGGVPCFAAVDFKKNDGFRKSLTRATELGLYRQNYCGCEFARRAAFSRRNGQD